MSDSLANIDAYWRAANYLSVGQIYLRQSAPEGAAPAGTHKASPAWPLGDDAGTKLHVRLI